MKHKIMEKRQTNEVEYNIKKCAKCKKDKNVSEFHKHKNENDGLQPYCKECNIETFQRHYIHKKTHKTCSMCNKSKEKTEFSNNSSTEDRLDFYCKPCRSEIAKKYYKIINKDKLKAAKLSTENKFQKLGIEKDFTKTCSKCNKNKQRTNFSFCRTSKDGLHSYCKSCIKEHYNNPDAISIVKKYEPVGGKMMCRSCDISKDTSEFHPCADGKFRLSRTCKHCQKEKKKQRKLSLINKETAIIDNDKLPITTESVVSKKCKRCNLEKNIESFYKHPKTVDRRTTICKECVLSSNSVMKTCTKCGNPKRLNEFYKRAASKDGKMNHCMDCHKKTNLPKKRTIISRIRQFISVKFPFLNI